MKSLEADDYVHGLALLVLIAYSSTYTVMIPLDYSMKSWTTGSGDQPSESDVRKYIHLELVVSAQFWLVIYLVKISFLIFYRRIFGVSRGFLRAWWAVLIFTLSTFSANFIATFWVCEAPQYLSVPGMF